MKYMLTLAGTDYLGYDSAGVVDEAGEGVTGVSAGDDVLGRGQNTQAGYAVLDAGAAAGGPADSVLDVAGKTPAGQSSP